MPPDDPIAKARECALASLKLKQAELEHGAELHRDALVFDAYGFAPACACDSAAMQAAYSAGATAAELGDIYENSYMTAPATNPSEQAEFIRAWNASGVDCIFQNAGAEGQSVEKLLKRLAIHTWLVDNLPEVLRRAPDPGTIEAAKREGKRCLYMTGNGVPLPQRFDSVAGELEFIRIFYQLGVRMMHLTYNRRNLIGDGCGETNDGGLSDFGRAVIKEMNRVGVISDVAHSGWRTSLEAAKASSMPMVASHTCCADLRQHFRGKPDQVIRAIAETDGYVGICCLPAFLGRSMDINAFLDHIDHAVRLVGARHVAIGTDNAYATSAHQQARASLPSINQRIGWEWLWPEGAFAGKATEAQMLSLSWTNWPLFTAGLVARGHSDEDIRNIIGGNVMRVTKAALAGNRG